MSDIEEKDVAFELLAAANDLNVASLRATLKALEALQKKTSAMEKVVEAAIEWEKNWFAEMSGSVEPISTRKLIKAVSDYKENKE